jgi:hypothetical protein
MRRRTLTRSFAVLGTVALFASASWIAVATIVPGISTAPAASENSVVPASPSWFALNTSGLALLTGTAPALASTDSHHPTVLSSTPVTLRTGTLATGDLVERMVLTFSQAPASTEVELVITLGGVPAGVTTVFVSTGTVSLTTSLTLLYPLGGATMPQVPSSVTLLVNVCSAVCP